MAKEKQKQYLTKKITNNSKYTLLLINFVVFYDNICVIFCLNCDHNNNKEIKTK